MSAPGENLRINGDRLWDSIHEIAKIGPGVAGGNNRQTVTAAPFRPRVVAAFRASANQWRDRGARVVPWDDRSHEPSPSTWEALRRTYR